MASSESSPISPKKENLSPVASKISVLNESRSELHGRIQNLKQDLQNWRLKLDTQVKVYRDELTDLKKSLHSEVDQLRSEFEELRTTLQQQQDDVTASLRNLGLNDVSGDTEHEDAKAEDKEPNHPKDDDNKETDN